VHSSQLLLLERCGSDAISSALLCLSSTVRTKAAGLYQALAGADALLVRLSCDAVVAAYVVTPITSYCASRRFRARPWITAVAGPVLCCASAGLPGGLATFKACLNACLRRYC
jgi:hypothetical protein